MNRILKDIIIIPLFVLFILMFVTLKSIIDISVNYFLIVICVVFGIGLKIGESYLNFKFENNKKDIRLLVLAFIVGFSFILFVAYNIQIIKLFFLSLSEHSFGYLRTISSLTLFKNFASFVFYDLLFILSYAWLKYIFIDKHINILLYLALVITFADIIFHSNVSIIHVITISLIIFIIILDHFYIDINSINHFFFFTVVIIFILVSFSSYLLTPLTKSLSFRDFVNSILKEHNNNNDVDEEIEYVLDNNNLDTSYLDDKEVTSFVEPKNKDYLENYNDSKGSKVIDIKTTYPVDRLKAYTLSKYDINSNSFLLNKTIDKTLIDDTTDLFIRRRSTNLPETMSVRVYNNDKLVYYPYGDLSFFSRAYLYNDSLIQFDNDKDYSNYSVSFNPNAYNNELLDKLLNNNQIKQSNYHIYAQLNYALNDENGNINYNNVPKPIYESIDSFMSKYNRNKFERTYDDYNNPEDFYYETRKNVSLVNYILKNTIKVEKEYKKNDKGLDDISNCLLHSHKANPQLLTELAVMMYRYFDIPSRFVIGYRINEYSGNNATIYENDKVCWAEVFVAGKWIAGDAFSLSKDDYSGYTVNDDMSGDISKDFKGDLQSDPIVLTVTSDYKIDRLKQSSFGDYNPQKRSFELEEDISNYKSIKRIAGLHDVNDYFKKLFVSSGTLSKNITISTYGDSNNVYVPYGNISINDVDAYQDKKLVLNKHSDSYSYTFNPYDNNYYYNGDALYENYVYEKYLSVPASMDEDLKDFLTNNNIDYNSNDKNLIIKQIKFLLQGGQYKYSLDVDYNPSEDYLLYFLTKAKEGFCQHFAGAATLLLRECGIPARYTVGFIVDDTQEDSIDVRASNAHAWVEVYTSNLGWCPVEVTVGEYIQFDLSEIFPDGINNNNYSLNFNRKNSNESGESNSSSTSKEEKENDITYDTYPKTMSVATAKIMNDEIEINDQVLMDAFSDSDLHYLKAFSTGNYNSGEFEIEENIDNLIAIQTIKSMYDIDNYFIKFTEKNLEKYSNTLKIKNYSANNYVYYPYGTVKIDDTYMYQDKCLFFNNADNYSEYDVKYNDLKDNTVEDENYDYESFVYEKYTSVPSDIAQVLSKFLNDNNIHFLGSNKQEVIRSVQELLLNNYSYTTKAVKNPKDIDPIVNFLMISKKGNASHFAGAATILYRICGIPARYVEGYYLNEKVEDHYSLTSSNKHSWVEVYTSNLGWVNIETTPDFTNEEIEDLQFERHIKLENHMEFSKSKMAVDRIIIIAGSAISAILIAVLGLIIYKVKKKHDAEYKKILESYGIETPEQLKLLKSINSKYMLLKGHGYYNEEIEDIMYRIRYSKKKENDKDLKFIDKHVNKMMKDVNYNMILNIKTKAKEFKKKAKQYIEKVKKSIKKNNNKLKKKK